MTRHLSTANEFIARRIGPRQEDERAMLASLWPRLPPGPERPA